MRPRWLAVGLVASLALNLFLLAAGGMVFLLGERAAHEERVGRPSFFVRATEPLPEPDRADFRRFVAGLHDQVQPALDQSRADRIRAWTGLTAPQPDAPGIKQLLARSRAADVLVRTKVEEAVVDHALGLPQSERAKLVDGLRRALRARGGRPRS
ncbi:MAG TPA: periplasmic heavy metal sensor [Caulobacteraceae bacterium]|jgi:uncharacterized membrane protein|nr:periplasmic heavy metal sensor [Caulobacteraceae bacterium]